MLCPVGKDTWDDDRHCASPAEEAGLAPFPRAERGLGGVAPVTEGELPWGAKLLLVLLLRMELRLPRLLRLCSPADAPGLCTAPDHNMSIDMIVVATEDGNGECIGELGICIKIM